MLTHCIRSASPCTLDADQSPGSRLLIPAATRRPLPPQLLVVPHGIRFGRAMYGVGTRMKRKGKGCVFRKKNEDERFGCSDSCDAGRNSVWVSRNFGQYPLTPTFPILIMCNGL